MIRYPSLFIPSAYLSIYIHHIHYPPMTIHVWIIHPHPQTPSASPYITTHHHSTAQHITSTRHTKRTAAFQNGIRDTNLCIYAHTYQRITHLAGWLAGYITRFLPSPWGSPLSDDRVLRCPPQPSFFFSRIPNPHNPLPTTWTTRTPGGRVMGFRYSAWRSPSTPCPTPPITTPKFFVPSTLPSFRLCSVPPSLTICPDRTYKNSTRTEALAHTHIIVGNFPPRLLAGRRA